MQQLDNLIWWLMFMICSSSPIVTPYTATSDERVFTPDGATTIDQCPNGKTLVAGLSLRQFPPTDSWDVELPNLNLKRVPPPGEQLVVVTPAPAFPDSLRLVDDETENKVGRIWAKKPFKLTDFYIEVSVLLGNSSLSGQDPRGVAFLFANNGSIIRPNPESANPVKSFGIDWDKFVGLAFFSQQRTTSGPGTYASFVAAPEHTPVCDKDFATSCCEVHLPKLENKKATYKIRVTSDDQGHQNLTVLACVSNTLTATGVYSEACNGNSNPVQFSMPLWNVSSEELYFGIAAMNEGYTASVDVFNVSVYNCSTTTTTTTTTTSSTTTSKAATTTKTSTTEKVTLPPTTTTTTTTPAATTKPVTTEKLTPTSAIGASTTTTSTKPTTNPSKAPSSTPTSTRIATSPTTPKSAATATPAPVAPTGQTDVTVSAEKIALVLNSASQQAQSQLAKQMGNLEVVSTKTVAQLLAECDALDAKQPVPPPPPNGGAIKITPHFSVDRFVEINTVEESITVAGSVLLTWSLTTCIPSDNITDFSKLYLASTSDVWTPPYRLANSASANTYLQLNADFGEDLIGTLGPPQAGSQDITMSFYWLKEGKFTSTCNLDLAKFPFDNQTCVFTFDLIRPSSSVTFDAPQFNWQPVVVDGLTNTREWSYQGQSTVTTSMYYNAIPTSAVHFIVTMKRNPAFYVINLIIPNTLLILVELTSFIMPPDAPDRAGFSVTLLLALTVAQSTVMGYIPRTSQAVLLVLYTTALSWLCAACSMYQMVVCWYATNGGEEESQKKRRWCLGRCDSARLFDLIASILAIAAFVGIHIYFLSMCQN